MADLLHADRPSAGPLPVTEHGVIVNGVFYSMRYIENVVKPKLKVELPELYAEIINNKKTND